MGTGLFALLLAALWAGTTVSARVAVDVIPPMALGGIRFALATLFMFGWCRWEGVSLALRRDQWPATLVMGALLFLQIATFNVGVAWSNASHATLLINTYVFWVAGTEHFLTRVLKLSFLQGMGLLIAALGASVLFLDDQSLAVHGSPAGMSLDEATLAGDLVLLVSSAILAAKVIYTKRAVRTVPSGTLIFWHDVLGTILFFAVSGLMEPWPNDPWRLDIVLACLYGGLVVSGFCFAGHAWLLRKHSASEVSVFSFATPVFGVILAILIRGDHLSSFLMVSGILVAVGIVLVNRRFGSPPRSASGSG